TTELFNPAITRFASRPSHKYTDAVLSSPRYRSCRENIYHPVSRSDFSGYWFVQDTLTNRKPPSTSDVTIFYLHGGGYFCSQPAHYLLFSLRLAEAVLDRGLTVSIFALDYSLAPEHQFPTQLAEVAAAYEYIVREEQVTPGKIIVAGDSAGGHLALSLLVHLNKPNPSAPHTNLPKPGGLVLLSPCLSLYHEPPSYVSNAHTDILSAPFVRRVAAQFLDGPRKSLGGADDFSKKSPYLEFLNPDPPIDWESVLPLWVWASAGADEIFFDDVKTWTTTVQKELQEDRVTFEIGMGKEHVWQYLETMMDAGQRKKFLQGKMGDGGAFGEAAKIGEMIAERMRS
ncbi:MAG: hypothetical protein LQ348_007419, partial [Seirophora lacunosa]